MDKSDMEPNAQNFSRQFKLGMLAAPPLFAGVLLAGRGDESGSLGLVVIGILVFLGGFSWLARCMWLGFGSQLFIKNGRR